MVVVVGVNRESGAEVHRVTFTSVKSAKASVTSLSARFPADRYFIERVVPMPMKTVTWWEYDCPDCETSNALPNPPFPAAHVCRECGRSWDVQKLRASGYVALQQERIPK